MTNIELTKEVETIKNAFNQLLNILTHYSDNTNLQTELQNLILLPKEKKATNE